MIYDPHEDEPSRDMHLRALRVSLRSLAEAGTGQVPLFPDQSPSPGELASSFEQASALVKDAAGENAVTARQAAALDAISAGFEMLSRDEAEFGVELWTDTAVATSEPWVEIRRLAGEALEAFDWSESDEDEPPGAR